MKNLICLAVIAILAPREFANCQGTTFQKNIKVAIVQNPYAGDRASTEMQEGPEIIAASGIEKMLSDMDIEVKIQPTVRLSPEEDRE